MERIEFGKYVVADLEIGQSKLTFKGTRICVVDVLERVADEMEWDKIINQCHGSITKEAIAEAILIASQVFLRKAEKPKERIKYGKYVVADPSICHGRLTFKGTELRVKDVLEMVAEETDWDRMVYGGRLGIPKEAITEAISLVSQVFAQQDGTPMARIELGKYVVADPSICHGVLTFKGTQRCVQDVLKMVADEMEWNEILHRWHNGITKEAIAEAVLIASQIFIRLKEKPTQRMEYGKYVVADPSICHGIVTFNGTRIFVQDALKMVADEMEWDKICYEWDNVVSREAIAEAIHLAGDALIEKTVEEITA